MLWILKKSFNKPDNIILCDDTKTEFAMSALFVTLVTESNQNISITTVKCTKMRIQSRVWFE